MQPISFEEILEHILTQDTRYHRDAYFFVREALDHTHKTMGKETKSGQNRHVTAHQLLEGIREFALDQFGPMAMTVFEEWNIRSCKDFGEIVFVMVEHSLLAKTEKDTREDFESGYDFYEAFRKPFLPQGKPAAGAKGSKTAKT
jgi:uncharacterized repeat protein (TIGR04138 family)